MLRQNGLALGGSLDNAIVIGETGALNNALRFEDEFVRHKILDVIGDLALVGYPIIGHLVAHRGGHALHTAFASRILEEADAWRLVGVSSTPRGSVCRSRFPSKARLVWPTEHVPPFGAEFRLVLHSKTIVSAIELLAAGTPTAGRVSICLDFLN